ncbi:MAG TPA: PEP-CTERM sorting domain-containing protein, partial [Povalibacter sp.]
IDLLRIEARTYFDLGMTGQCNVNKGCGHFDIDDVTVVSTPEPETLALLLMGLMGTWLHRRRRHVM